MGLQDFDAALPNAYKSLNTKLRAVCTALTNRLHVTLVAVSPAPTTTGFSLVSAAGFQATDPISVVVSGSPVQTTISTQAGVAITVPTLAAAPSAGAAVKQVVTWYPPGARKKLKPEDILFPHVYLKILRMASPDRGRQRLRTSLQLGICTNLGRDGDAWALAGQLLAELGISQDNPEYFAEIPQTDSASGLSLPLLPMDLQLLRGFEEGPDDTGRTHLFSELSLFHE